MQSIPITGVRCNASCISIACNKSGVVRPAGLWRLSGSQLCCVLPRIRPGGLLGTELLIRPPYRHLVSVVRTRVCLEMQPPGGAGRARAVANRCPIPNELLMHVLSDMVAEPGPLPWNLALNMVAEPGPLPWNTVMSPTNTREH